MNIVSYSSNDSYKYRLAKTRQNVLKGIYKKVVRGLFNLAIRKKKI